LANSIALVGEVADLKCAQWRDISPDRPYRQWLSEIERSARIDSLPLTLVLAFSMAVFRERVTSSRIISVAMVLLGMALLGRFEGVGAADRPERRSPRDPGDEGSGDCPPRLHRPLGLGRDIIPPIQGNARGAATRRRGDDIRIDIRRQPGFGDASGEGPGRYS